MSSIAPVKIQLPHQVPTATPNRAASVAKHALVGGAIGAVGGAALTFTALPFVGTLGAPIAAAIGGAAGLLIGGAIGLFRSRGSAAQVAQQAPMMLAPANAQAAKLVPPAPARV